MSEQVARLHALPQSVIGFACEYPKGFEVAKHRHPRGQLIYACSGTLRVLAAGRAWIIPPNRALWVPPNLEHGFTMQTEAQIRTLYVKKPAARTLPRTASAIVVSPLLRELLISAASFSPPDGKAVSSRRTAILRLAMLEIRSCVVEPLSLRLPRDRRLAAIAQILLRDLSSNDKLPDLASTHGMSERTLRRRFIAETGVAPGQWRQQARLLLAFSTMVNGASITQASMQSGYDSPSAFSAAFRRVFGRSPTQYLSERE